MSLHTTFEDRNFWLFVVLFLLFAWGLIGLKILKYRRLGKFHCLINLYMYKPLLKYMNNRNTV